MNATQLETVQDRLVVSLTLAALASLVCALMALNIAELQGAATIVVRAQAPESLERPIFDLGMTFIVAAALAPILVVAIALFRRWSLVYYLAWIVATAMLVFVLSAAAAFTTYRYWREHQAVAQLTFTPRDAGPVRPHAVNGLASTTIDATPIPALLVNARRSSVTSRSMRKWQAC